MLDGDRADVICCKICVGAVNKLEFGRRSHIIYSYFFTTKYNMIATKINIATAHAEQQLIPSAFLPLLESLR